MVAILEDQTTNEKMTKNKSLKFLFIINLLSLFIVVPFNSFAQMKNPPGTILLKDNLYIDEAPICNVHYREYAYCLSNFIHYNLDTLEIYTKSLPYYKFDLSTFFKQTNFKYNQDSIKYLITDTAKKFWNNWIGFSSYLNHTRFNYFPVVNINCEIANSFCRWRTSMVKMLYAAQTKEKDRKKMFDNFEYRLATYEELKFATEKFKNENKLKIQLASKSDSLPSFDYSRNGNSLNRFVVSSVTELCTQDFKIYQTSWDINKQAISSASLIDKNWVQENLTFRCVCEVR